MLRATAIGLVSAVALSAGVATSAQAHMGGGGGGGGMHSSGGGGSGMHGSIGGGGGGAMMHTGGPSASFVSHDVAHDTSRMHVDRDHMDHDHMDRDHMDHDHDGDHDHDRFRHFRFFPSFAFGFDNYADDYYPYACWDVVRVRTHLGWRYRRIWVCD